MPPSFQDAECQGGSDMVSRLWATARLASLYNPQQRQVGLGELFKVLPPTPQI